MRRLGVIAFFALSASCAGGSSSPPSGDNLPVPPRITVHVSPTGSDDGLGTVVSPYRTLRRALAREGATEVVFTSGTYDEPEVSLARTVALLGPEEGGAVLKGHVRVAAAGVVLSRLDVTAGVELDGADRVVIDSLSVKPGTHESALRIQSSTAQLSNVEVTCGRETCVEIQSSTVAARGLRLEGDATAKRGLRAETSSVSLSGLSVRGTQVNQVLAAQGTRMTLVDAELTGALGTALVATSARLEVERARFSGAARHQLLVQLSQAIVRSSTFGPSPALTMGVAGADLELIDVTCEPAVEAILSISQSHDRVPRVKLVGGTLRHGGASAVLLAQGELTVEGTRFIGDPKSRGDADAISATGATSVVRVFAATFESPAGFAVSLTNDASGTITATISRPREGGVFVENVAVAPVVVTGSLIERCGTASGVLALSATDVSVTRSRLSRCAEGGVVAGLQSNVRVARSALSENAQYGLAAFGGSTIEVETTRVSGSRWATFASCGDGASVEELGGNKLSGPVASCP